MAAVDFIDISGIGALVGGLNAAATGNAASSSATSGQQSG